MLKRIRFLHISAETTNPHFQTHVKNRGIVFTMPFQLCETDLKPRVYMRKLKGITSTMLFILPCGILTHFQSPPIRSFLTNLKTNGGKTWVLKAKKAITFTTKKNLSSTKNCLNKCCFKNTGIKSAGGITARILFFSFTHRTEDDMFL